MSQKKFLLQGGLASLAVALATTAVPAFAQDDAAPAVETAETGVIVVTGTGTRIADSNLTLANPVLGFDSEELDRQAVMSVEQALRILPGVAPGVGAQVNNGNGGLATFNLRGLGSNRNLVLMNNRRVTPSTLGAVVDLNIIPLAMIERVEVLTGGAVTTYGADAIAGVVNFTTRQNFEGVDLQMLNGITERGDGRQFRVSGVFGTNTGDGRGNVTIGLDYTKTEPVLQGSRGGSFLNRNSTCPGGTSPEACAARAEGPIGGSATAVPASFFFPGNPAVAPGLAASGLGGGANIADGVFQPGLADFNFAPPNLFQAPLERFTIMAQSNYEVAPAIEVYAEGMFSRSKVRTELAPTGTFFSGGLTVPFNNPFISPAALDQLCGVYGLDAAGCANAVATGAPIPGLLVGRRFVETGPRITEFTTNLFQFTAGVRGKITDTVNFDVFGQYGESDRRNTNVSGNALAARVNQALQVNPNNPAACLDPSQGCVPINLFGPAGSITPEMLNFISVPTSTFSKTTFETVQAIVSGDFGVASPLASTPIAFAAGAEYRKYSGSQFGDIVTQTAGALLGAGGAFPTVGGDVSSTEFFGELIVPLIEDRPGFYLLQVDGGFRYSDFNTTGGNWTYKAGVQWAPIEDIKFRGAWTRAIRTPNIGELFAPQNTVLSNLSQDPCQGALGTANATTAALCTAQLAAVGLPGTVLGNIPAPIAGQINVTVAGNPLAQPETATTWTAGAIFQPTFVPGLVISADWYRISLEDAITSPGVGDVINGCFGQANPANTFCQLISRDPTTGGLSGDPGLVRGLQLLPSNLGFIEREGIDINANYIKDVGEVTLNFNLNANHSMRNRFQALPTSFIRECQGFYSVDCDGSMLPDWSVNLRSTVMYKGVDVSLLWRYISDFSVEPRLGATPPAAGEVGPFGATNPAAVVGGYREISSYNWFDLNVGFNVTDEMRVMLLVENLFDRKPPQVGSTIGSTSFNSGNTFPSLYDALGRRYTVTLGLNF
ncbi:MAG: TonB-dependent receptor domain-containing protein [Erythrobacter sp.]